MTLNLSKFFIMYLIYGIKQSQTRGYTIIINSVVNLVILALLTECYWLFSNNSTPWSVLFLSCHSHLLTMAIFNSLTNGASCFSTVYVVERPRGQVAVITRINSSYHFLTSFSFILGLEVNLSIREFAEFLFLFFFPLINDMFWWIRCLLALDYMARPSHKSLWMMTC